MGDSDNQNRPAGSSTGDGSQPSQPVFPSNSQTREGDQPTRPVIPAAPVFPGNVATRSERWEPPKRRG